MIAVATQAASQPLYSSVDRVEPGSYACSTATLPRYAPQINATADELIDIWISSFNRCYKSDNYSSLSQLFAESSYWRDQLCISWDFHTLAGPAKIIEFLKSNKGELKIKSISLDVHAAHTRPHLSTVDAAGIVPCAEAWLVVETTVGKGRGIVKVVQDPDDAKPKAYTLFTTLQELEGHKESTGQRRPNGVSHGGLHGRKNWKDRLVEENNFVNTSPIALIIGAGQGGLSLAARMKQLGVPALIIDKSARVGDSWRQRYHQLVLHDPVWYDHLPYLPFPSNWPVFTPKDKLADWFQMYATVMELAVWNSTTITEAKYDDSERKWTVVLNCLVDGKETTRTLHPKHVVLATGHSGEKNFPSHIKGISEFEGDRLCHSSEFSGAKENGNGKKAVLVGSGNSAHDIAQDFYENGYEVTMVQRSSTYVVSSKSLVEGSVGPLYHEGGLPAEEADMVFHSIPNAVMKANGQYAAKIMAEKDAEILKGLAAAGFKTDQGPDGSGLWMKYCQRSGGYYIDVGCSQLIADGKVKIIQGTEITEVAGKTLKFSDGREVEADEVVFATGYQNMRSTARKIFGNDTADRLEDVWGLDEEGEVRTLWRRTRHPGFWFMAGNLAQARYYSRLLALQVQAAEVGLMK